jgi:hypothetical protein
MNPGKLVYRHKKYNIKINYAENCVFIESRKTGKILYAVERGSETNESYLKNKFNELINKKK